MTTKYIDQITVCCKMLLDSKKYGYAKGKIYSSTILGIPLSRPRCPYCNTLASLGITQKFFVSTEVS